MSLKRVINHFVAIKDQKCILTENINGIIDQISKVVELLEKSPDLFDKEDLTKMLYYQIALVKYLSDVNLGFIDFQNKNEFPVIRSSLSSTINAEKNEENDMCSIVSANLSLPPTLNNAIAVDVDTIRENLRAFETKLKDQPKIAYGEQVPERDEHCVDKIVPSTDYNIDYIAEDSHTSTDTEITNCMSTLQKVTNKISFSDVKFFESAERPYTAQEKLKTMKINDRLQEAIDQKCKPIPDIKMLPAEPPSVIKNNLHQGTSDKKFKKGKNCNKDNAEFEIKHNNDVLKVGSVCVFSHVENPGEFYLHIINNELPLLDHISDDIAKICRGSNTPYNSKEEAFMNVGTFCFAYISGYKNWYRVQILDWFISDKQQEPLVHLLDFGNMERVSWKLLRKITKEYAEIPVYAIKCHLPLLYPPGSTHDLKVKDWPESSIDAIVGMSGLFTKSINNDCKLFKVVFVEQFGDSLGIDLYNIVSNDETSTVGQILIELGQAVEIVDIDYEDKEMNAFLENIDDLEIAENLNEAIVGYDAKDEARICKFTKPDGTCWKRDCKLEHTPFLRGGYTSDKDPTYYRAFNSLDVPLMSEPLNILITGYKDCCTFYGQIIKNPFKICKGYHIDKDLYSLLEEMNNKKVVNSYERFKVCPTLGEVVIVKHSTNKWVRGLVTSIEGDQNGQTDKAKVHIVDYGDSMEVSLSEIRKMKEQFLHLPFQLIHVYLENAESTANIHDRKVQKFLNSEIVHKNFLVHFSGEVSPYPVRLTKCNGQDIGELLIKQNMAQEKKSDINPVDHIL